MLAVTRSYIHSWHWTVATLIAAAELWQQNPLAMLYDMSRRNFPVTSYIHSLKQQKPWTHLLLAELPPHWRFSWQCNADYWVWSSHPFCQQSYSNTTAWCGQGFSDRTGWGLKGKPHTGPRTSALLWNVNVKMKNENILFLEHRKEAFQQSLLWNIRLDASKQTYCFFVALELLFSKVFSHLSKRLQMIWRGLEWMI